jgi:hypothetical protein
MVATVSHAAHVVRNEHSDAWDAALTLRDARAEYFRFNGFGDDGGYNAKWVDFKLGPIPFPFPNTPQRLDAVRYHDLHHVMTGYQTDFTGELEISGWELGSGCINKPAALILNLGGYAMGMMIAPRRTFRSFVRGRHSRNLYRYTFGEHLLDRTVGDMRRELDLESDKSATPSDVLAAAMTFLIGFFVGAVTFWTMVPLAPFGYLAGKLLRK